MRFGHLRTVNEVFIRFPEFRNKNYGAPHN